MDFPLPTKGTSVCFFRLWLDKLSFFPIRQKESLNQPLSSTSLTLEFTQPEHCIVGLLWILLHITLWPYGLLDLICNFFETGPHVSQAGQCCPWNPDLPASAFQCWHYRQEHWCPDSGRLWLWLVRGLLKVCSVSTLTFRRTGHTSVPWVTENREKGFHLFDPWIPLSSGSRHFSNLTKLNVTKLKN